MQSISSMARLGPALRASPTYWWPFVRGWLRRKKTGLVPCLLPQARQLLMLPWQDYYMSYAFLCETRQGRRELSCFLNHLDPGEVLYDIGGFRGAYAMASRLKLDGNIQVQVFEPVASNAAAITRICDLNCFTNVRVLPLAVGDCSSITGKVHSGDGMLRLGDAAALEEVQFQSVSLDQHLAEGSPVPTVLKIDVDGYELRVLNGARDCLQRHRPRLWLEVHPDFLRAQGKSHEDVLTWLRQAGYEVVFFEDHDLPTWQKSFHIWCVPSGRHAA